jgi:hypothetical protein
MCIFRFLSSNDLVKCRFDTLAIFTLSVARDATLRAISQETDTTGCAADSAFTLFEICRSAG